MNDKVAHNNQREMRHIRSKSAKNMVEYIENYPFIAPFLKNGSAHPTYGCNTGNDFESDILYPFSGYIGDRMGGKKGSNGSFLWKSIRQNQNAVRSAMVKPIRCRTKIRQNNNYNLPFKNGKQYQKVQFMTQNDLKKSDDRSKADGPFTIIRK